MCLPSSEQCTYTWTVTTEQEIAFRVLELVNGGGGLGAKSCPTLATPWTVSPKAPLSMRFSRQEHWSGLPFPSPGDLPEPGIKPRSPALQADSFPTEL